MVWLRLRLETDSSCLYCNPSFICTVCTEYEAFLCALCFASEGPLGPVKHCFILITSHDKKDYGCVQMNLTPSVVGPFQGLGACLELELDPRQSGVLISHFVVKTITGKISFLWQDIISSAGFIFVEVNFRNRGGAVVVRR